MKKYLVLISFVSVLFACNSAEKTEESTESKVEATVEDVTKNPVYQAGLVIEAKSDCITCHKVNEKLIGPSYQDIAAKYASKGEEMVPNLAQKIIEGGVGVWGEVPMTPHSALTKEEAETMVRYIFLVGK